jgi:two-component system, OmpR family, KDP operon response regulator KdpE
MDAPRVLIIEDDGAIRSVVRSAVEADGAVVVEAATGAAGLALALAEPPDLVVLDLGLPDVDGRYVCRTLREAGAMPILVLSARHADVEKAEMLDGGADDYLTKPFSTVELRARVRAQLRRARERVRAGSATSLHVSGLHVDLDARTMHRDGAPIRLTRTEWALCRALIENAGRTVTHDQLFAMVWGRSYGDAQKYLRVYVAQLRRKIEQDSLRPSLIVTEPGVGYRFVIPEMS